MFGREQSARHGQRTEDVIFVPHMGRQSSEAKAKGGRRLLDEQRESPWSGMKLAVYQALIDQFNVHFEQPVCDRTPLGDLLPKLAAAYWPAVTYDTLRSIYAHVEKCRTQAKSSTRRRCREEYYSAYKRMVAEGEEEALVVLAENNDCPPYSMVRLIVESLFLEMAGETQTKKAKDTIKEWLSDPSKLQETLAAPARVAQLPLETLCKDIRQCRQCDDTDGPLMDRVRRAVGDEYEYYLLEQLHNLGVPFMTEDMMRLNHYPKTPDAVLKAPMEVCGLVVYWIESKACFGDPETMEKQFREQISTYRRRIGPGIVIYWFGFVEDVSDGDGGLLLDQWRAQDVLVLSSLPEPVRVRHDLPGRTPPTWRDEADASSFLSFAAPNGNGLNDVNSK